MARANDQWQRLQGGGEVLAIFQGPHAYISPSWYEAELAVPTWNYVAVHAYGIATLIEEDAALTRMLGELVHTFEAGLPNPWRFQLPTEFTERMLRGIVGFRIEITRLEGKLKLSQNRSAADRKGAVTALQRNGDPTGVAVAQLMADLANAG
jgi:transcriptional regulator